MEHSLAEEHLANTDCLLRTRSTFGAAGTGKELETARSLARAVCFVGRGLGRVQANT